MTRRVLASIIAFAGLCMVGEGVALFSHYWAPTCCPRQGLDAAVASFSGGAYAVWFAWWMTRPARPEQRQTNHPEGMLR